eukprot:6079416-Pleurochrysis_carterae.AAC.1
MRTLGDRLWDWSASHSEPSVVHFLQDAALTEVVRQITKALPPPSLIKTKVCEDGYRSFISKTGSQTAVPKAFISPVGDPADKHNVVQVASVPEMPASVTPMTAGFHALAMPRTSAATALELIQQISQNPELAAAFA